MRLECLLYCIKKHSNKATKTEKKKKPHLHNFYTVLKARYTKFLQGEAFLPPAASNSFPLAPGTQFCLEG